MKFDAMKFDLARERARAAANQAQATLALQEMAKECDSLAAEHRGRADSQLADSLKRVAHQVVGLHQADQMSTAGAESALSTICIGLAKSRYRFLPDSEEAARPSSE